MVEEAKKRGRPPTGARRGKPLTIYITEPRERLFEEVFSLMRKRGILPSTANYSQCRTEIIDHALDALVEKLSRK